MRTNIRKFFLVLYLLYELQNECVTQVNNMFILMITFDIRLTQHHYKQSDKLGSHAFYSCRNRDGMRTEGGLKALCDLLWESTEERVCTLAIFTRCMLMHSKILMRHNTVHYCTVTARVTTQK